MALLLLSSAIGCVGQDKVILRYASPANPSNNPKILAIAFVIACPIALLMALLAWLGLSWFALDSEYTSYFYLFTIWVVLQTFYMLSVSVCRSLERWRDFAIIRALYTLSKLVLLNTCAAMYADVKLIVMCELALLLLVCVYVLWQLRASLLVVYDKKLTQTSLNFGLPLTLHVAAGASLGQIDKIMLTKIVDVQALGVYAFVNALAGAAFFIFAVVNISYETKVYQLGVGAKAETLLGTMCKLSMYAGLIFLIPVNLLLEPILDWVGKSEFYHPSALLVLTLAYLIYPLYLQANIRLALKEQTQLLPVVTGLTAAINVALNVLFIPLYGILGAALSTLFSYILLALMSQWVSRKGAHEH